MDPLAAHDCANRLSAAFLAIAADSPAGSLYLSPLLRAARRVVEEERDHPRDLESRLVAQATLENVERAQSPWRFAEDEPLCSRLEAAAALQSYIAGRGDNPAIPLELDLDPIVARYNGPLGGAWRLESTGDGGQRIIRSSSVGEDEQIAATRSLRNAVFLAAAHDDVAALLAEIIRLRGRIDELLRADETAR